MTVLRLDEHQLRQYLSYYGSDMLAWPPQARAAGQLALRYPDFVAIIEEEKQFEEMVSKRIYAQPGIDLVDRILARAQQVPQLKTRHLQWAEQAAIAAVLVLGFTIGFGTSAIPSHWGSQAVAQSYTDEENTAL